MFHNLRLCCADDMKSGLKSPVIHGSFMNIFIAKFFSIKFGFLWVLTSTLLWASFFSKSFEKIGKFIETYTSFKNKYQSLKKIVFTETTDWIISIKISVDSFSSV